MPTPNTKTRVGVTLSRELLDAVENAAGDAKPGRWLSMLVGDVMRRARGVDSEEAARAPYHGATLDALKKDD